MQQQKHSEIELTRFRALYPRLLKQKVKESGTSGKMMSSINMASREIQQSLIQKCLSTTQRLQVIHTIAKSEIETRPHDQTADSTHQQQQLEAMLSKHFLDDSDLYLICLHNLLRPAEAVNVVVRMIKNAQAYVGQKLQKASDESESYAQDVEHSLCDDEQLTSQVEVINFMLRKSVLSRDTEDNARAQAFLFEATRDLQAFIVAQSNQKFWRLIQFAPYTVWYEPLNQVFQWFESKGRIEILKNSAAVTELLTATFDVLKIYKENSKYYVVTIGSTIQKQNDSQTGEQSESQPSVRRMSKLFTEILNILVQFLSVYLKSLPQHGDADKFYQILVRDASGFMFNERLQILNELNVLFLRIESINTDDKYWQVIREGLSDSDQACRKLALNILKAQLKNFQDQGSVKDSKEFQLHWQTFFDIYDTLESFGSHLTKSVWHRTELFYTFIQDNCDVYAARAYMHPLQDMRMWLLVLYHRVASHNNIKIRRFIQKTTLRRKYITPHMREFFFNEFIVWLNQCLIFKDVNQYTQYSKNAASVIQFYQRYFRQESINLQEDLKSFFYGYARNKSHSQMTLICLKVLSEEQPPQAWFTDKECSVLLESFDVAFNDQIMSSRYLCYKYILKMLANAIDRETGVTQWSQLFKIISNMPVELFSSQTVFDDQEAQQFSSKLVFVLGKRLEETICSHLQTLFVTKAMTVQIPKFGKDAAAVLNGISKLLLVPRSSTAWLTQTISQICDAFDSQVQSTYLQSKLVEEKVEHMTQLCCTLYQYGDGSIKQIAHQMFAERSAHLLIRWWDLLCVPLARDDELLPSESDKIEASLLHLQSYTQLARLAIKMNHLDLGREVNAIESAIRNILAKCVLITGTTYKAHAAWSAYLLQWSVFEILQSILSSYVDGIKTGVKAGKSQIFIHDDIFVAGRVLLQNLLTYQTNVQFNGGKTLTQEQDHFFLELDLNPSKINQKNTLNQWRILAHLVSIFNFDPELREMLSKLHYGQQISKKTIQFMDAAGTPNFNQHLFQILKTTFLPQVVAQLRDDCDFVDIIEDYQQVVRQCWLIIKEQKCDVQAEDLLSFVEIAFCPELLERYQQLSLYDRCKNVKVFHETLAREMLDYGNKYWLIMRTFFNHLMVMIASKPHLLRGLENFVCGFGTTRECRSLDAKIKLHRLETMLPQVIPKKYEDLPMEEITYQGAYIRTVTLIILEGMIHNYLTAIKQGDNSIRTKWAGEGLTNCLLLLLNQDKQRLADVKSEMPFSDQHRLKLRTWQMISVMTALINDPHVVPARGVLEEIHETAWKILEQNFNPQIRMYTEVFAIRFILRYPDLTLAENSAFYRIFLEIKERKPQTVASSLIISGIVLLHTDKQKGIMFKRKILDKLIGYCCSNSAHCRNISQYFFYKLSQQEPGLIGAALQPLLKYLTDSKDSQKIMMKYERELDELLYKALNLEGAIQVLQSEMGPEGEFIGVSLGEELVRVCTDVMTEYRHEDEIPIERKDWWKHDLAERKVKPDFCVSVTEESSNYQRKILPWEHIEFDSGFKKSLVNTTRQRNQIVLCAALIDKIPNLAGLARTSEIMNANSLIINNAAVTKTEEFKGISVTSERWLPIYEVKEHDLLNYLTYMKANDYRIVGIEQTANSKMLHNFEFPTRCVLLLGKEKEGIPQEYYSILDYCVEIPQFGIIRSLNVHVSGALCLWEYTKQHMPVPAPSAQTNVAN